MMEIRGNSDQITRRYLDSLLVETRYLNSETPNMELELYGKKFSSPIMTAALSHLDPFVYEGASQDLANGAAAADVVLWLGMAENEEVERCAAVSKGMIEIIKPYKDRKLILEKIEHAEKLGILAVGIDVDHAFAPDGLPGCVEGHEMKAMTTAELKEICAATKLPVIVKGVLSVQDAVQSAEAGAGGIVLSHHHGVIEYAVPPLAALPEIKKSVPASMSVFVDCGIMSGMDAFKALALGAAGVGIGRPLMKAVKENGAKGVTEYLEKMNTELRKAMAFTGCTSLEKMDPGVVHFTGWL